MIKAKFSNEVKKAMLDRDKQCIICWAPWTDCHHVYFWTESNYDDNRNDLDQGVILCRKCHNLAHSCKQWEWVRQKCIDYLLTI